MLSGAGALGQVAEEVDRLGCERALLLTTRSVVSSNLAARVEAVLGRAWVGTYPDCRQHVPTAAVREAVGAAIGLDADVIVSLGGGSVIDAAKAAALELGSRGGTVLPHVAIPTTLSGAEFTPVAGVTDEVTRAKNLKFDSGIVPRVVILDPEATQATPQPLWLATGVKALDHAFEALWSRHPHPVADALALEAIRQLTGALPRSRDPHDVEARERCQLGAWMSIAGVVNVGTRLSHPLAHQMGAYWAVPHGVTSCIVLPHVMRFLAAETLDQQVRIAGALGVDAEGHDGAGVAAAAANRLEELIASLGLPTRLRDTGARHEEIPIVASAVSDELAAADDPPSTATIEALLQSMW